MFLKSKNKFKITKDSLRLRLTLFFVIALALLLFGLSLLMNYQYNKDVQVEFDNSLYNYVSDLSNNLNWNYFGSLNINRRALIAQEKILPFKVKKIYLQILSGDGKLIASLGPNNYKLIINASDLQTLISSEALLRTIKIGDEPYRMISFPIVRPNEQVRLIMQVAVPMSSVITQQRKYQSFLIFIIPIALLIIFFVGFVFSSIVLAPLNDIIFKTRSMSVSNLKTKFDVTEHEDELNVLAVSLNELFDRLDKAFSSQEDFIANASHQLKTPLAILKGQLDVFKTHKRTEDEVRSFVKVFSNELDHLIKIVNDLLVLASLDAGKNQLQKEETRVDELLFDAISRFAPIANKKNVQVKFDILPSDDGSLPSSFTVMGDASLLKTTVQALLENALHYSPKGEKVKIELGTNKDEVFFSIINQGDPIPAEAQKKIFERFYQSSSQSTGIGLGLAICQKIIKAHEGEISVMSDLQHGTQFFVHIKKI